jgi:hypothetical protein
MSTAAGPDPIIVGRRVAAARHAHGLTQRDLARALGLSLHAIDRIEAGIKDPALHLPDIAVVTRRPAEWFVETPPEPSAPSAAGDERAIDATSTGTVGRVMVLGAIVLLVTVRFFTEVVPVLPRAANFIDIPIFLALVVAATCTLAGRLGPAYLRVGLPATAFIVLAVVSATVNADRALVAPVLVFIYGFLAPLAVYAVVYRIWPPGNAASLSRILVWLGLVQLTVIALIGLPRFATSRNPDFISGTFGTNAYQLVFFLLVVASLLAGIFVLEPRRAVARFVPLLILAIFVVILLAQYRALLASTIVVVLVVSALLGTHFRGALVAILAVIAFGIAFAYVVSSYPGLRLGGTATTLTQSPSTYVVQRYRATRPVAGLYRDYPLAVVIGSGPGTFSSRAWQTFANAESASSSNVQGGYAQRLTGGVYETDVSRRYVEPQRREGAIIEGSRALSSPYSSYLSLAAEVGLVGLALMTSIYLAVLVRSIRIARREVARATPGDPIPALAIATAVGFLTLLQMGFLENWLEVTRITFLVWAMLAVVSKELDSRSASVS